MNVKGKRLLIVGAGRGQVGLYKAAKEMGVHTIAGTMPDNNPPGIKLADEVCLCPFTSIDDKEEGIDIDITYLQDRIENSRVVDANAEDAAYLASLAPAVFLFMSSKDIYNLSAMVKECLK